MKTTNLRKISSRIIVILLVMATLLSLSVTAFAAKVSSVNIKASAKGGEKTVFYVTVPANKAGTVKLTMSKGQVNVNPNYNGEVLNVYASYEIKVWRYVNGAWKQEQKFDAYHASSKNIEFKKYSSAQKYKVEVWFWKTNTTMYSYLENGSGNWTFTLAVYAKGGIDRDKAYWRTLPTCVAKNSSNCTLYTSCP